VRARGGTRRGGIGPGSNSSLSPIRSREGDGPDRRDPPISERKEEGRKSGPRGENGPGRLLGRAQEEKGKEEKERRPWAGLQGKMGEGKRKRKVGWAQLGNKREKEMHPNAFEFKF
jgi:hypothetical protein